MYQNVTSEKSILKVDLQVAERKLARKEEKCTYGCAGDHSIKMCGGLGYINIFHTDAHKTEIDDWGCGNSAQDLHYQKWYADMGHCGITG